MVFWLAVTFRRQNSSADKCAILDNLIDINQLHRGLSELDADVASEFCHQKRYFCVAWWRKTGYFLTWARRCFILSLSPPCHAKVRCNIGIGQGAVKLMSIKLPRIAHLSALEFCRQNVMASQKTTNCSVIVGQNSQSALNGYFCYEEKWEGPVHSPYLNVRIKKMYNAFISLDLNQRSGEKRINVLNTYKLSDRQFKDGCRCFWDSEHVISALVKH